MRIFSQISKPEYDKHGRMKYNPECHPNHLDAWKHKDEQYLIDNYVIDGPEAVAAALGRTIGVVMTRAYVLRKEGKMPKRKSGDPTHKRIRNKNYE